MKNHFITSIAFFLFLGFTLTSLKAQDYSGLKPIQDFHRHNAMGPLFTPSAVLTNDTLAWVRFRGLLPGGKYHTGANIMSWVTGPVMNNSFPANLVFRTGNQMRMTVRDNGYVGVNTFLPEALFTVSDSIEIPVIRFDQRETGRRDFEIFLEKNNGNLFFRGGADGVGPVLTNRMVITHDGSVGIGIDAPAFTLHTVGNTHTTGNFYGRIHFDDNQTTDDAPNTYNDESYFELKQRAVLGLPADPSLHGGLLSLAPGATSNDHQLFFGNDGIFHRRWTGNAPSWAGAIWYKLLTGEDINGTPNRISKFTDPNRLGDSQLWDDGSNVGIGTDSPDPNFLLDVNGDTRVRSKLAVNTDYIHPDYELAVDGAIVCEEVQVMLRVDWPDYVFDPAYSLKSLKEVEKFIEDNRRLPGIPSAAEISEGGLALGKMQTMMMEKIEELFLHMIEMEKRIKELEAENRALKESKN